MSDFEDIQRLLRLKRYERPSEDFVEDFVRQFQHRQRQELLRHSARGLLWERVNTYFEGFFAPKWRWAGGMAVAVLAGFMVLKPTAPSSGGLAGSNAKPAPKADDIKRAPITDAEVERYLISRHFEGGLGDDIAQEPESDLKPVSPSNPRPNGYIRQDVDMKGQFQR